MTRWVPPEHVPFWRGRLGAKDGSLHLLLMVLVATVSLAGLGTWGLLRHWRFQVETQLRLNRCVGKAALKFRGILNRIDLTNRQIRGVRVAIVAAELEPWLIPPLKASLQLLVTQQQITLGEWEIRRGKWLIERGCEDRGDHADQLPGLRMVRDPPDLIGPHPLRWQGEAPNEFSIQVHHPPRAAAVRVSRKLEDVEDEILLEGEVQSSRWSAAWRPPSLVRGRAGFR